MSPEAEKQAALHNITVLAKCLDILNEEIIECATPQECAAYVALDGALAGAIAMEAEKLKT